MNATVMRGAALATVLMLAAAPSMAANTLVAGSGAPFSNYQPSLALNENIALQGVFPTRSDPPVDGADLFELGMIRTFAGSFNPGGWNAYGAVVSIAQNTALFSVIGTQYGGSGVSTFNLPDLRDASIIGATSTGARGPYYDYQVGQTLGSATVTLDVSQLPAHDHTLAGGGVTGSTGGGASFDQHQPSLTMTYLIAADGVYPAGLVPVAMGQVVAFAGNYVPLGWRAADGTLLNIADHANLFSVIGNTYGGDGVTTFALPDLRGKAIVGVGAAPGESPIAYGETIGSSSTVLTLAQMAAHDHGLPGGGATGSTGGADPVGNYQPSLGLDYLIATAGVYPTANGGLDGSEAYFGEIVAYAGTVIPNGFLPADGRLMSIADNPALFALLGVTYGGDGVTTFALPDLRGRSIIGAGGAYAVGDAIGSAGTVLTEANLPAHDHSFDPTAVPEPSTWAMLICGLGVAGAGLRRRARAAAA